jgi:hypothetical protein
VALVHKATTSQVEVEVALEDREGLVEATMEEHL